MSTTRDFAAAVGGLQSRGEAVDEAAPACELRWNLSGAALIGLGQQAEREGLVRITYAGRYERHYLLA